jgi:hypothetical protein
MNWQQHFDLGADTERWWREHIRQSMPYLRHTGAKEWDFKGKCDDTTVLVDVKFCKTRYRKPGWIEVKSWGKLTGIVNAAKSVYNDDNTLVSLVVLHCGWWFMYDVKLMLQAWRGGTLPLEESNVWDDAQGEHIKGWNWQMKGWEDERFLIQCGPLRKELWNPRTSIGEKVDINAWFEGEWKL